MVEPMSFPNSQVHDDLVDALAYIDQVQTVNYQFEDDYEEYVPLDDITGE